MIGERVNDLNTRDKNIEELKSIISKKEEIIIGERENDLMPEIKI